MPIQTEHRKPRTSSSSSSRKHPSDHVTSHQDHVTSRHDHVTSHQDHVTSHQDHVTSRHDHVTSHQDHVTSHHDHVPSHHDHVTSHQDHVTRASSVPPTIDLTSQLIQSPQLNGTDHESPIQDRVAYITQDYSKQILEILNDLRKAGKFCNLALLVCDKELLAHKSVLAASSGFFRSVFESKEAEKHRASVSIQGIAYEVVEELLQFAYTGGIKVGKENVKPLLRAAVSLQFLPVKDACCDFLRRNFSCSNVVGIRYFAILEDCTELVHKAEDFISRNFTDVAKSDEFYMLSYTQLADIVNLQRYPFRNEQVIAIALFCWVHHDIVTRRQHFKDTFSLVKLEQLPAPFVMNTLLHNELINEFQETREAVLLTVAKLKLLSEDVSKVTLETVMNLPNLSPDNILQRKRCNSPILIRDDKNSAFKKRSPLKSPASRAEPTKNDKTLETRDHHKPRPPPSDLKMRSSDKKEPSSQQQHTKLDFSGNALFVVGGACNVNMTDAINKVEFYNPVKDCWAEAGMLRKCRSLVGVTVLRDKLYAVGGFDGISPIDSVEYYSAHRNTWHCVGRMISARRGAGVTTLNDKIYAIGGYDGTKLLSLCEVYHDNTNSWDKIANLQTCRFALGAAAVNGTIYAVGGFDGHSHLSTVEMFDSYTNTWINVASMSMSRYAVGVTSCDNVIYAVGGLDGTRPLSTVERYDPRLDKWEGVGDMDTQRAGVDVTCLDNHIYSVGGILGSSPLQTVERYDVRANKWEYISKMSIPRVDAGAGSILV